MSKVFATKSFFDLYSEGSALAEEIDDFISVWHEEQKDLGQKEIIPLHEFLGMSNDEYNVWVQDPDVLPHILNSRLEKKPLEVIMQEHVDEILLAARAANPSSIIALKNWLKTRNAK